MMQVDAALDLSHTQNIGRMIKAHFPYSQFIVVSLKEGMFSNANVLFRTKFVDGVSAVTRTATQTAYAPALLCHSSGKSLQCALYCLCPAHGHDRCGSVRGGLVMLLFVKCWLHACCWHAPSPPASTVCSQSESHMLADLMAGPPAHGRQPQLPGSPWQRTYVFDSGNTSANL